MSIVRSATGPQGKIISIASVGYWWALFIAKNKVFKRLMEHMVRRDNTKVAVIVRMAYKRRLLWESSDLCWWRKKYIKYCHTNFASWGNFWHFLSTSKWDLHPEEVGVICLFFYVVFTLLEACINHQWSPRSNISAACSGGRKEDAKDIMLLTLFCFSVCLLVSRICIFY